MAYENTARYYDLFHPEKRERISCIKSLLKEYGAKDVLDTYCRTGTISMALAKENYNVTGIDKDKEILSFFRKKIRGKRLKISIKELDIKKMDYKNEFDAILSLKTSINRIVDSKVILAVLKKMRNALRDNGILILEFVNFLSYLKAFKPEETTFHQKEHLNIMRYMKRDIEDIRGIIIQNEFGVIGGDGTSHSYYKTSEMKIMTYERAMELLEDAGFKKIKSYVGYSLEKLDKKAERFIIVAKK
ncbi:MAG: methyltransferase domain-containing protein [Euryarchaeota archaeon]|nr:methyltransferase domain-containing protein [Euryarchaeota archaeon]